MCASPRLSSGILSEEYGAKHTPELMSPDGKERESYIKSRMARFLQALIVPLLDLGMSYMR